MAKKSYVRFAHMVSVHDEPVFLRIWIPNVYPGEFFIPGVNADPEEIAEKCRAGYREAGMSKPEYFQYAEVKQSRNGPYILLTIPDARTIRVGTEVQKTDEFGGRLQPDVQRAVLTVRAEEVCEEVRRQVEATIGGNYGVIPIDGEEPTDSELKEVRKLSLDHKLRVVNEVSKTFGALGRGAVNLQAQQYANDLYRAKKIQILPAWAEISLESKPGDETALFSCQGCGKPLREGVVRCECGAIYNWKKAVELGYKSPQEVPESKRAEAGLGA